MKAVLKGKLKETNDTSDIFKSVLSDIAMTSQVYLENNLTDITENSRFISNQMKSYKTKLEQLRSFYANETTMDENKNLNVTEMVLGKHFNKI